MALSELTNFSGEPLHTVLPRLLENCVQLNSAVAVKCLELLAGYLTTDRAAVLKFVLKSMTSLFEVAKASVLGEVFWSTLRRLAVLHETNNVTALLEQVRWYMRHVVLQA